MNHLTIIADNNENPKTGVCLRLRLVHITISINNDILKYSFKSDKYFNLIFFCFLNKEFFRISKL